SGEWAMARANPTRRRMPPDSWDGSFFSTPSRRTIPRHSLTRSSISCRDIFVSLCRGKATLLQTVIESNRAPSWNAMPNLRRNSVISRLPSFSTATPSTSTERASGFRSPMTCFRSTLLPVPEPPMITSDSPAATSRSTPSSTSLGPNDLWRSRIAILEGTFTRASEEDPGEEEVRDQDGDARHHHGRRGGPPDPLGAARGVEPLLAPDGGEQEAEDRRLDQPREEVGQVHVLEGAVDVGVRVRAHHDHRHHISSQ